MSGNAGPPIQRLQLPARDAVSSPLVLFVSFSSNCHRHLATKSHAWPPPVRMMRMMSKQSEPHKCRNTHHKVLTVACTNIDNHAKARVA